MKAALHVPEAAGEFLENEPMSRHTSWRVGGPADLFFRPEGIEDLAHFLCNLDADIPVSAAYAAPAFAQFKYA
mgnify:CR=1 FL=1